ncbi:LysR substrate-binding domain-containing protein [Solicola sp. PLA-1-18]|uniref:LysR substrate-binding domain-containing protein n=1 Tax=Solicola sp. PLA-1-18 TaxID=3380532 RepID=UPI003B75F6C1
MELRHLRYFVAVAETRHFGRAAERLHLAQPALSQSVRQLEAELGTTLLARTTRQVSLTPAGEFFYAEAVRTLQGLDDAVRGVARIADGRDGLVRVGFTGTAAYDQLPRIARAVKQDLPDVALEIHADLLTPAQVDGLRSGHLDLAVLRPPVAGDDVETRTVAHERLLLALPADHRLVSEPALDVADVGFEDFVMYADAHSAVNEAIVRTCRAAGFAPRRQHEAPGTSVLLALVAAGLGVAMVPESARAIPLAGVIFREITGAATIDLALAWRRNDTSPLVSAVVEVLDTHGLFEVADPVRELGEVL